MDNLSFRLEQARKNAQLTRDEVVQLASQTSGFSRSSLQDWEQQESSREPKIEYLFDLARIYGVHPWTLMTGEQLSQSSQNVYWLALLDMNNQSTDLSYPLPNWWLNERAIDASQLVGYLYKGDTMSPLIGNDAVVIVNKQQNQLIDGAVYALLINNELFIRRIQRLPTGLKIISDNQKYSAFDISQEQLKERDFLAVIGQVIYIGSDIQKI